MTPVKKAAAVSILRIALTRDASSPAEARRQVRSFADENDIDDPAVALLIVSELVTNAVLHGSEPIELRATVDEGRLRIEVSDGDPDAAAVARPGQRPPVGGRGLDIVESLTRSWGTIPHAEGKTVWVELGPSELASSGPALS